MAITPKERELAAVGISVAAGCKPCTDHHVEVARKARASDAEIRKAVVDGLDVRMGATKTMARHALAHLGEQRWEVGPGAAGDKSRLEALVRLGAAFAVNCVSSLATRLAAAERAGISREEIAEILHLAAVIKDKAASHVERLVGMTKDEAA